MIARNKMPLTKSNMTMASEEVVHPKGRSDGPQMTTGMLGLLLLIQTCEHIQYYVFFRHKTPSTDCEQHYWEKGFAHRCNEADAFHEVTEEHILWAAISEAGRLRGLGNYHTRP
eukprot:gnl/MRDRNA2_/MRDRNA2_85428_c0_seq1.p2 gnl/MRDRNA2_/MRDRNA2_85428_c0~~gnl/MRDRNA2_/MRDRNA2_85428_c0_seq1.p2  ORF type:complete len:114 (+),score=13.76 gnl/MRDRNA2_/MRDRNA2_85428_c0_seq1:685-1026(+)